MSHYFQFSRDFSGGHRLCAECRLSYDHGAHIEITVLKPYTKYVCPSGGGLGHKSTWTGAYRPDGRSLRDHLCTCGAELVEEDTEQWQLSWEMQTPLADGEWKPVTVVRSRHAAHEQRDGLLQLIEQGEPIRNVVLAQVDGPVAAEVGRCGQEAPRIAAGSPVHCALPHGHPGWHRGDDGSEWNAATASIPAPDDAIVDRVARALHSHEYNEHEFPWDENDEFEKASYRGLARAALAAARARPDAEAAS